MYKNQAVPEGENANNEKQLNAAQYPDFYTFYPIWMRRFAQAHILITLSDII